MVAKLSAAESPVFEIGRIVKNMLTAKGGILNPFLYVIHMHDIMDVTTICHATKTAYIFILKFTSQLQPS